MRTKILFLLFFLYLKGVAQIDSVAYTIDYVFKEGLYLTEQQFIRNAPVSPASIVADISSSRVDFLTAVTEQDTITLISVLGTKKQVATNSIWGYCQNQIVHVRFKDEFVRVNTIGTLCRFTTIVPRTVTYMTPMMPGSYGGGIPMTTTVNELKQFILDVRNNNTFEYTLANIEQVLKDDSDLYDEFMKLRRRKRNKAMYAFFKRYLDRHPLYLPK